MNYLLDTHTFIWTILNSDKLSSHSKLIISDKSNIIIVSAITFWEIALKTKIKKFSFKGFNIKELPSFTSKMGFDLLSLDPESAINYYNLSVKKNHKDPFDRMLICQAIQENLILISKDKMFELYKKDGLKLTW